jgi:hypothetical protein
MFKIVLLLGYSLALPAQEPLECPFGDTTVTCPFGFECIPKYPHIQGSTQGSCVSITRMIGQACDVVSKNFQHGPCPSALDCISFDAVAGTCQQKRVARGSDCHFSGRPYSRKTYRKVECKTGLDCIKKSNSDGSSVMFDGITFGECKLKVQNKGENCDMIRGNDF